MNVNQIIVRLKVDAASVRSDLGKIGNSALSWGKSLAHDLRGILGSFFAVSAAVEGIREFKDQVLEIKRLSEETGESSNFIQSLMLEAKVSGTSLEALTSPLIKFNRLIGEAKMGIPDAVIALKDMGVIADKNSLRTMNYSDAIHNLAVQFDKLHDRQKQDALLNQAFGKGGFRLSPIFQQGSAAIDKMNQGNFFTKISPDTINDYAKIWTGIKVESQVVIATVSNGLDFMLKPWKNFWVAMGSGKMHMKDILSIEKQMDGAEAGLADKKMIQAMADKDQISVEEEKAKILASQNDLLERQSELTSDIADRDKMGVTEMAERARKLLGVKSPLEMSHTVTKRMRTALQIDTLEERAKLAWQRGDDQGSQKFQAEADQIRSANTWLKRADRNPMQKTESELAKVTTQLEPVKRMAELVTKSSQ